MLDKLAEINVRFEKLTDELGQPNVVQDQERFRKLSQEHSGMQDIVECYRSYLEIQQELDDNRDLAAAKDEDPEIREMAEQEILQLRRQLDGLEKQIQLLLIPKDPDDSRNIIIEIRAGTGGDEAAFFARDLFQMYAHYAEGRNWRIHLLSESKNDLGGFKEIIFSIEGKDVFSHLKFEGGVHRVQRVPKTETQGRIHTSAATVAILPEVEDVEIEINPGDLRIDVYRSSGPGGQSVNTTDSAVRITHIKTGLVVICQNEKSQLKNKAQALKVLRARLYEKELQARQSVTAEQRRGMVGSGDRSERIRTYNFPQGRMTDHRINLTLYKLEDIMLGKLEQVIDPLLSHQQAELLKAS
jgi:peptide chain release factor 1